MAIGISSRLLYIYYIHYYVKEGSVVTTSGEDYKRMFIWQYIVKRYYEHYKGEESPY